MLARPLTRRKTPLVPFVATVALIGCIFTLAVIGRLTGSGVQPPTAPVTAERVLRFADRDDGAVVVSLAPSGDIVKIVTGQSGFLRGTLRGFARTRRADKVGSTPPLRLTGFADGRLILSDPSTGRHVEVEAFGSLNEAVFVDLLTRPVSPPPSQGGA